MTIDNLTNLRKYNAPSWRRSCIVLPVHGFWLASTLSKTHLGK